MDPHIRSIGRYEVERLLGEGGMGVVYLARDPTIGRKLAIKVLRTDDEEYRRRFRAEVSAAGALRHRHIVTIFDSGEHEGSPFLAMEYVPGETLGDKIKRRDPAPLTEKLRYIEELCEGLAHAHAAGIVHRDIKPTNVIVDADSESVKIVDFGIARAANSLTTESGMLIGTLSYMSPEQVMGKRVDQRSDIFSVGLVLYELLSYGRAFPGGPHDGLMYRIAHEEPVDLATLVPGLNDEVAAIARRALRKDPAERYGDIRQFAAELKAARRRLLAQEEQPTLEHPSRAAAGSTSVLASQKRPFPRRGVAMTAGLVTVAALCVLLWQYLPESPGAPDAGVANADATSANAPPVPAPSTSGETTPSGSAAVSNEARLQIQATVEIEATLDGKSISSTSAVRIGEHMLILRRPGVLGTREQQLRFAAGETRTVTPDLAMGWLVPGEFPFPYASVTVNGEPIIMRTRALTGELTAEFAPEPGSAAARRRQTFNLAAESERNLSTLVPQGGFRFEVTPIAEVILDQRSFGTVTKGALPRLSAGTYSIRIAKHGYNDFVGTVQIRPNQETLVGYTYSVGTASWVAR